MARGMALFNLSDRLAQIKANQDQNRQFDERLNLLRREQDMLYGTGQPDEIGLRQRETGVHELNAVNQAEQTGINRINAETNRAQMDFHKKPFRTSEVMLMKAGMKNAGILDAVAPAWNIVEGMASEGASRGDIYIAMKSNWPNIKDEITQNIGAKLAAAQNRGDTVQVKKLSSLVDSMGTDSFLDQLFPGTKASVDKSKAEATTNLGKLLSEREVLPAGDPRRTAYDAAIVKATQATGLTVESDGKGGFKITQGPVGPGGSPNPQAAAGVMEKKVVGEVQTDVKGFMQQVDQLRQIRNAFNPEMLNFGSKLNAQIKEWQAKGMTGFIPGMKKEDLSEQDKQAVDSLQNMRNQTALFAIDFIKSKSGAAFTDKEREWHLKNNVPNAGDTPWDGDSAITYKRKLENLEHGAMMGLRRSTWLLKNGMQPDSINVWAFEKMYNEDGNQIAADLKNQGMAGDALKKAVLEQLTKKYGM